MFSQDLIKYIMSLKNCNTICKKQEIKITKKKNNNIYQKIAKMHFLDNHKSEWEHEIKTNDPISFEFENIQNSFSCCTLFGPF